MLHSDDLAYPGPNADAALTAAAGDAARRLRAASLSTGLVGRIFSASEALDEDEELMAKAPEWVVRRMDHEGVHALPSEIGWLWVVCGGRCHGDYNNARAAMRKQADFGRKTICLRRQPDGGYLVVEVP